MINNNNLSVTLFAPSLVSPNDLFGSKCRYHQKCAHYLKSNSLRDGDAYEEIGARVKAHENKNFMPCEF